MPSELAVQRAISAMGSLIDGTPVYVPRGAQITNGRGDAFVHIDWTEHQRRQQVGLKAITQLWHLDLLMNLPLDQPVDAGSLTADEKWCLERIPAGAIERDGNWAIRRCKPVISIAAVIGWGPQLQKLLRSVAPFARVAQRMVVLDRIPTNFDEISWEASYDGVGVWLATDNESTELISPEPVRPRYYTPARWKVNEHAYRAWLATCNQAPTAAP